jgi:hypothetical protein
MADAGDKNGRKYCGQEVDWTKGQKREEKPLISSWIDKAGTFFFRRFPLLLLLLLFFYLENIQPPEGGRVGECAAASAYPKL